MEKFDRWHRLLFLHELAPLGAGGEVTKNHEEPDSLNTVRRADCLSGASQCSNLWE